MLHENDPQTGKRLHAGNMPARTLTPMTQEEVDRQCDLISRAADWDPGEDDED